MKNLQGKTAIVTGSSSGVGAATVKLLASLGCDVLVNYHANRDGGEAVAEACRAAGVDALVFGGSVAEDESCRAMAAAAAERWGRLDILVNNAGTTKFVAHDNLDGLDAADFQRIYGVNVIGVYQMTRAARPFLQAGEEGGNIVNVASTAGIIGIGSSIAYAASKGALVTMGLSLARALGPKIRVNTVCPGFIQGDWLREGMGEAAYGKMLEGQLRNTPLRQTATPESVAEAILQFITGSPAITGQHLIIDGGLHLTRAG
ncbi:MAG: SDR family oxidoreductase [Gammaproteobacteria bacterium]|nr:SDR family oxidoreductase [Gammaproteobacteria bacterium]